MNIDKSICAKKSHHFTKVPLSERLAQRSVQNAVVACCSTTTMHLDNTSAIEVLSRSTTVNKTAGLVRDTSLRTVGSLQLVCTVVDISLPTGDANPGNVVAMLKLMGKQQHQFHHEAIMTSSKALVEELSNQETLRTTESQWGQILRNHDRTI